MVSAGGAYSTMLPIKTGIHQGSTLGPALFIIAINDFPEYVPDAESILFVDDTYLANESSDLQALIDMSRGILSRAIELMKTRSRSLCLARDV